jgi:TolB-like protein/thioredoxin-like negative regulator of GroEL
MSSLLPDYEYDIFISYRYKDNRYGGWVTEFVDNLKRELEATFKEEVNVYFDISPHDGLLENHIVDASLIKKLKCLIFVPIISQTYCDPKSYAWQHEFVVFNKMANEDKFGRDITLANSNVASRILPVKIHELDPDDQKVFEDETGGVLRAIEFIYKEPGVNRPLSQDDDLQRDHIGTKYRNQINKVANAIKEIITGIRNYDQQAGKISGRITETQAERSKKLNEKSIIVLPFGNISPNPDNDNYCASLTEKIITSLSHINDLLVISGSTSMTFKGSQTEINEITDIVNVKYALYGNVRRDSNNLFITAQLLDGMTNTLIWSEQFEGTLNTIFQILKKISSLVVNSLKLKLTESENVRLMEYSECDLSVLEYWLRAKQEIHNNTPYSFSRAFSILEDGLRETGNNEFIYWAMGYINWFYLGGGTVPDDDSQIQKVEKFIEKIFSLNKESFYGYQLKGLLAYKRGDTKNSILFTRKALEIEPNNPEALNQIIRMYANAGKTNISYKLIEKLLSIDPLTSNNYWVKGWTLLTDGKFKESLPAFHRARELDPQNIKWKVFYAYVLFLSEQYEKALDIIRLFEDNHSNNIYISFIIFIKNAFLYDRTKTFESLKDEFFKMAERNEWFSLCLAQSFALIKENREALYWIEHTVNKGFINYPFLSEFDPTLENIRREEKFMKLMAWVKQEWEGFEI